MIVYVDISFFENLILDFIILLATAIISNNKICFKRLILSSIIGSIYTVGSFIIGINNILLKFVISLLIIWISFGFKSKKRFLKNLGVFYLTSLTFGRKFIYVFIFSKSEQTKF